MLLPLLLLDDFCRPKAIRWLETSPGPLNPEQVFEGPFLPDGYSCFHQGLCPSRKLGHVYTSLGCLLPHPRSSSGSQVAPFCVEEQGFPVSSPPFCCGPCSLEFYEGSQGVLCIFLRQGGLRLKVYLDDWLILTTSADQCHKHTRAVREMCRKLGVHLNPIKSEVSAAKQLTFLGILFDTVAWQVGPADHSVHRFSLCISRLLQDSPL